MAHKNQSHEMNVSKMWAFITGFLIVMAGSVLFMSYIAKNQQISQNDKFDLIAKASTKAFSFDPVDLPGWTSPNGALSFSPKDEQGDFDCFNLIYFDQDSSSADSLLEDTINLLQKSFAVQNKTITNSTLTTTTNRKIPYKLMTFELIGSTTGFQGVGYAGNALGYIPVDQGHIVVKGFCKTLDQIPTTLKAIKAFRYNPNIPLIEPPDVQEWSPEKLDEVYKQAKRLEN